LWETVSDNFDERIEQKIFHSEIVVDNEKSSFRNRRLIKDTRYFVDENGQDNMKVEMKLITNRLSVILFFIIEVNWNIKNDPDLQHLVQEG
jgi:hypothetical protein